MTTPYAAAGVEGQGEALAAVLARLGPTLANPEGVDILTRFGHYAAVARIADDVAIAVSTDGVGSKTLIASALGRYDTIGIDCVAMNVNDIVCVGARPVLLVDYLGVHRLEPGAAAAVLAGLAAGADEAGIAIPAGEIAQLPGVLGPDPDAFDLVGTCIGVLHPDELVTGAGVRAGDVLIGLESSGIHSNGLTLARAALVGGDDRRLHDHAGALGRPLGDELLEPTRIYVRALAAVRAAGVRPTGMAHITGDGLANLCRLDAPVGFVIERLPPTPPVFELIRVAGSVPPEEMYRVFNMGIGFVLVVAPDEAERVLAAVAAAGYPGGVLGRAHGPAGTLEVRPARLGASLVDGDARFAPL